MKSKVSIAIQNFEIIRQGKLSASGLTGVVGETNHGKSSIVRAIHAALYNDAGTDFITQGQTRAGVAIQFEGFELPDTIVKWAKDSTSKYIWNNQKYKKCGRSTPPDIAEAIAMLPMEVEKDKIELNFLHQLDSPLLRTLSDTKMYNMLVKSLDGDKINGAVRASKRDLDEYQKRIATKQTELEVYYKNRLDYKARLARLDPLLAIEEDYQNYLGNLSQLQRVARFLLTVAAQNKRLVVVTNELEWFGPAYKLVQEYPAIAAENFRVLSQWSGLLGRENKRLAKVVSEQRHLSPVDTLLKDYRKTLVANTQQEKVQGYHRKLDDHQSALRTVEGALVILTPVPEQLLFVTSFQVLVSKQALLETMTNRLFQSEAHLRTHQESLDSVLAELQRINQNIEAGCCPVCTVPHEGADMDLTAIKERLETLNTRKTTLEGQRTTLEGNINSIKKEIVDAGFDPLDLVAVQAKLKKEVEDFEVKATKILEGLDQKPEDDDDDFFDEETAQDVTPPVTQAKDTLFDD